MDIARFRLEMELARWRRAGRRAPLWWRDDDAREPSPALARLLALAHAYQAPLSVAVVPDYRPDRLAAMLGGRAHVSVLQHGVDHLNRRTGASAGEFPEDWTRWKIAEALRASWSRLEALPGAYAVFVPPWNDVHPALPAALKTCGYVGFSAWGALSAPADLHRIDAHLDLMRWRDGARFRGEHRLYADLGEALRLRRRQDRWDEPIGLLTHHLAHDEAAWAFLAWFLDWSVRRPELRWTSLPALCMTSRRAPAPVDDGASRA